ncbi:NUDIX domain-containing protein [Streptomyces sp. TLI_146]|uniref:NUDIX domain-containing protein n=1 Tax=Streptomyces sp. TLI_146 TaxID=1938858 RepID=UPI000C70B6F2|nr:NUDIX domain-containing protein [Streptomyces sp. TLI_146]PKV84237.1 ADP-ribose pyrophosphatase YjhB (NUDIX family) [Streptomyces sp. TLI_146]
MSSVYRSEVDVVVVLHRTDGRVLLLRRAASEYRGQLTLVGGRLERDEWYDDGARREVREEVGVHIDPGDLELCCAAHLQIEDLERRLVFLFTTQRWSGDPHNAEPDRHTELVWADPGEPPADCHPVSTALLEHFVAGSLRANITVPASLCGGAG